MNLVFPHNSPPRPSLEQPLAIGDFGAGGNFYLAVVGRRGGDVVSMFFFGGGFHDPTLWLPWKAYTTLSKIFFPCKNKGELKTTLIALSYFSDEQNGPLMVKKSKAFQIWKRGFFFFFGGG